MFKKITIVLCLLLITYANADKQALLVGVSDYGGNPRNDLPGIEKDIVKMNFRVSRGVCNLSHL